MWFRAHVLNGSGLRLGMELLQDNFVNARSYELPALTKLSWSSSILRRPTLFCRSHRWQASSQPGFSMKKLSDLCAPGKSGSSALDMFAPTWTTQDFGQIVYLSSTQRSVGPSACLPMTTKAPNTGQNKRGWLLE